MSTNSDSNSSAIGSKDSSGRGMKRKRTQSYTSINHRRHNPQLQFQLLINTLLQSNKIVTATTTTAEPSSSSSSSSRRSKNNNLVIRNPSKRISKILENRDLFVHVLTSNDALDEICDLPSLSLVHLLSVLLETDISQKQTPPLLSRGKKKVQEDVLKTTETETQPSSDTLCNDDYQNDDMNKSHNGNNNIHSVLRFVERVMMGRYLDKDKMDYNHLHHDICHFLLGCNHEYYGDEVAGTSMDTSRKEDYNYSFIVYWTRFINKTTCKHERKHEEENQQKNMVKVNENVYSCAFFPFQKDANEDWVLCMIFMMAYTALYDKINSMNDDSVTSILFIERNETTSESFCQQQQKQQHFFLTVAQNEIIMKSLNIILFCFIVATNKNNADNIHTKPNVITSCFLKQWSKVNTLVQNLHGALSSVLLSEEKEEASKEKWMIGTMIKNDDDILVDINVIQQPSQEETFHALLEEIEEANKNEDSNCKTNDTNLSIGVHDNHMPKKEQNGDEDDDNNKVIKVSEEIQQKGKKEKNVEEEGQYSAEIITMNSNTSLEQEMQKSAMEIRQTLFEMGQNATSNVVQSSTHEVATLLQKAGKEYGAKGITIVASILKYGTMLSTKEMNHTTAKGSDDIDKVPSEEGLNERIVILSDVFVSSLCKACITEETSAVRASTFMTEFVLPSINRLRSSRSRTASRLLITTISFLARERPAECATSLLVPALCSKVEHVEGINTTNNSLGCIPTKAQCELVSKIVKQVVLPKDILASIISDLTKLMIWNEQTIPIITTCLLKKPQLSQETVKVIVHKICECTCPSSNNDSKKQKEMQSISALRKGIKFSTLFHTFVIKYGTQIKEGAFVNVLLEAAELLKTMLKKSISISLKKLK